MALNPFFLQGSPSEQSLVQSLINEQLRMYGIEITYIPRKFVKKDTIFREITSSKFDDNFSIEAYVNTYDGHIGAGDLMTKFGVSLKDELVVTISKERFESFIAPFLDDMPDDEIVLSTRPREGDLIYFPLGQRIFEVKFVEHEQPFYQLGKTYVYELKCELFEYENEIINTSIEEIDSRLEKYGPITTLNLVGYGITASIIPRINTGFINKIYLNNDGYGYTSTPTIEISRSPINQTLAHASAVAITTSKNGVFSVKEIVLTNAGYGYTTPPTIKIISQNGIGAAATCSIEKNYYGVTYLSVDIEGQGYTSSPSINIAQPIGGGITATAYAVVSENNVLSSSSIRITNPGLGYTTNIVPNVLVSPPQVITGIGTYVFNETVVGSATSSTAIVKSWDPFTGKLDIAVIDGSFSRGETVVGSISSARYSVNSYSDDNIYDKYSQNNEIEQEADLVVDFSESNPFGVY